MIMIIVIIYIFLSDMIFDQQLKITLGKSSAPLKKPTPLKIQKLQVPPVFAKIEIFFSSTPHPVERGGEDTARFLVQKNSHDNFNT